MLLNVMNLIMHPLKQISGQNSGTRTNMHTQTYITHITSFPGLRHFQLHKERGGPGNFFHVHDIKGRKD